jgi:hypothetical protein
VRGRAFGFTVGELGFLVAFLFAAGLIPRKTSTPAANLVPKARADSLQLQLSSARDSLRKLRSNQKPSCIEKRLTSQPLADITIAGPNDYIIDGTTLTFADIRRRFSAQLAAADSCGCTHSVRTFLDPAVGASAYNAGLRQLQGLFYCKIGGVAGQ